MSDHIILQPLDHELTFCADDLPLLTAQAVLPHWEGKKGGRFNRYYRACADSFCRTCQSELFPRAEAAYCRAREAASPIPQWQARLTAAITLQREHLISLRCDTRVTGMPQRYAGCRGDTWDLRRGLLLSLPDCFPSRTPWRRRLLELAAGQIESWETQGIARYHDGWSGALGKAFHAHHFYLTEDGLCFFFPLGSIAPAAEGIPTFCLPYDDSTGPFIPNV